ncbi:MAG: N-acetyl-1-D-myo-inositol-2-amino-2-deoxy-alpha-D-glucopyranoside deacetylase [Dermatophilaceae bacterium]
MRLLFVHAHPDDESIATGVAIGAYAAAGHDVHVLTCTLGEQGEVIPPELRHLDADHDDALGEYRLGELRAALGQLGATGHVLGAGLLNPSRYRDSGMAGSPSARRPDAFVRADLGEAITLARKVIDEVAPDIVVTYDNLGGYAHPDHIQAHRVACAAVATMASPPTMYAALTRRSWVAQDRAWVAAHVDAATSRGLTIPGADDPLTASMVPDALVTRVVQDAEGARRQAAAMRAHATQIVVEDGWFTLSNLVAARLSGREGYAPLDPRTGLVHPGPAGEGLIP